LGIKGPPIIPLGGTGGLGREGGIPPLGIKGPPMIPLGGGNGKGVLSFLSFGSKYLKDVSSDFKGFKKKIPKIVNNVMIINITHTIIYNLKNYFYNFFIG
jgi:hypothetical protein